MALPSTPEVTAWPRALAASALVTTEQESKLPAVARAGADREGAAVAPVVGTLDDEADAGEEDEAGAEEEDEADEAQAVSKRAAQLAKAEIATGRRRIPASLSAVTRAEPTLGPRDHEAFHAITCHRSAGTS